MPLKEKSEEDPTSPLPNFTFETRASQTKWAGELLKGCCEEAESLKLYASQLVLVLDGNVMLLGAFDELVDLKKIHSRKQALIFRPAMILCGASRHRG